MDIRDLNNQNYVAHYTSLDTAVKYIIENRTIKVNSICNVNDPYENTLDWLEDDSSTGWGNIQEIELLKKLQDKLFRLIKVFCTTSFDELSVNSKDISNHIYGRPRMWAQYGDNHEGVCLIFDKNELNEQFETLDYIDLHSGKIDYEIDLSRIENTINVEREAIEELLNSPEKLFNKINSNLQYKYKFMRKHVDWKTENEYRWLLFCRNDEELFLPFYKSLKAIVFGAKVHHRYFSTLRHEEIPSYFLEFKDNNYMVSLLQNK